MFRQGVNVEGMKAYRPSLRPKLQPITEAEAEFYLARDL